VFQRRGPQMPPIRSAIERALSVVMPYGERVKERGNKFCTTAASSWSRRNSSQSMLE